MDFADRCPARRALSDEFDIPRSDGMTIQVELEFLIGCGQQGIFQVTEKGSGRFRLSCACTMGREVTVEDGVPQRAGDRHQVIRSGVHGEFLQSLSQRRVRSRGLE
jgi:hypothetical protein